MGRTPAGPFKSFVGPSPILAASRPGPALHRGGPGGRGGWAALTSSPSNSCLLQGFALSRSLMIKILFADHKDCCLCLSFFIKTNRCIYLGPSTSPPGDLHGHSQFLGKAKQTFPWPKSLPPRPCSTLLGQALYPAAATQEAASCKPALVLFVSFNLGQELSRQSLPTQISFTWLFKTQNKPGLRSLSHKQSPSSCGAASFPVVSSHPMTHPTALGGPCGRAG